MTGESLQLFLNYKAKTFSGRSKLIAFVVLVSYTLRNLVYLNLHCLTGNVWLREPLTALTLVYFILGLAWAAQATVYHTVKQDAREQH